MKYLFLVLLFACNMPSQHGTPTDDRIPPSNWSEDSLAKRLKAAQIKDIAPIPCPVKVISAKLVTSEGGNYKNISLVYKNESKRSIDGVRFEWLVLNVMGEVADRGSSTGLADQKVGAGQRNSGTWNMYSSDAKKIVYAKPIEVVYSDGTKWKAD